MEIKDEILFEKELTEEDFEPSFIQDLGNCSLNKLQLIKREVSAIYDDGKTLTTNNTYIRMDLIFKDDLFINKTGYLHVIGIFFKINNITGYIREYNIKEVLKPEVFEKLAENLDLK
jgi:hypothetical protein